MKLRRCRPSHHSCSPYHRQLCEDYWAARQADEEAMEQATALYPAEVADYKASHQMITFKQWLTGRRYGAVMAA